MSVAPAFHRSFQNFAFCPAHIPSAARLKCAIPHFRSSARLYTAADYMRDPRPLQRSLRSRKWRDILHFKFSMRGITAGIDIGTTVVTTAVIRRERDGKLHLAGVGQAPSAGLRRGAGVDAEAAAGALGRSLQGASRASGVSIRSAVVGVGGSHVGSFTARGVVAISRADGEITEDDAARVVRAAEGFISKNPNREVIHVIPREFKIDGQGGIRDPVGMAGMKLEVEALVIDGAKQSLQNLIRACELSGLEVEDWVCSNLAAAEVLLSERQKELGVILLDLGAGTTNFAIFEEGILFDVGSFPIGGGHITSDIAIGFRTQVVAAEAIKLR